MGIGACLKKALGLLNMLFNTAKIKTNIQKTKRKPFRKRNELKQPYTYGIKRQNDEGNCKKYGEWLGGFERIAYICIAKNPLREYTKSYEALLGVLLLHFG